MSTALKLFFAPNRLNGLMNLSFERGATPGDSWSVGLPFRSDAWGAEKNAQVMGWTIFPLKKDGRFSRAGWWPAVTGPVQELLPRKLQMAVKLHRSGNPVRPVYQSSRVEIENALAGTRSFRMLAVRIARIAGECQNGGPS